MLGFLKKKTEKEEDKNAKGIEKVVDKINVKCAYGAKMELLSEQERIIYMNHIFQTEFENGGFSMLFFHPAGAYALEMVQCLEAIGCVKCAQLLTEALAKLPAEFVTTKELEKRQDLLEQADPNDDAFLELNEAMGSMGEDMRVYLKAYMLKHKADL